MPTEVKRRCPVELVTVIFRFAFLQIQPVLLFLLQVPQNYIPLVKDHWQQWEPMGVGGCWIAALEIQGHPSREKAYSDVAHSSTTPLPLHTCFASTCCIGATISANDPVTWRQTLLSDPLQLMGSSWKMSLNICALGLQSKRKDLP